MRCLEFNSNIWTKSYLFCKTRLKLIWRKMMSIFWIWVTYSCISLNVRIIFLVKCVPWQCFHWLSDTWLQRWHLTPSHHGLWTAQWQEVRQAGWSVLLCWWSCCSWDKEDQNTHNQNYTNMMKQVRLDGPLKIWKILVFENWMNEVPLWWERCQICVDQRMRRCSLLPHVVM